MRLSLALKRILSGIAAPLFQLGISRIQKIEWLEAYYRAHKRAFSTQTIKSGFSSTGIFPFNPDKPLTVSGPRLIYPSLQHQFLQQPLLFPRRRLDHFPLKYLQAHPPILLS